MRPLMRDLIFDGECHLFSDRVAYAARIVNCEYIWDLDEIDLLLRVYARYICRHHKDKEELTIFEELKSAYYNGYCRTDWQLIYHPKMPLDELKQEAYLLLKFKREPNDGLGD